MDQMPVLFVGHGSPMNAIEDNVFSDYWKTLSSRIPRPNAILSVSAHWFTRGIRVCDSPLPSMIYDMYGFPDELYQVRYPAHGSQTYAHMTKELVGDNLEIDNSWGIDHGTWSVLRRVYPAADIPVFQLSVNASATAREHYEVGQKLRSLRNEGVLISGSGNVVHNLSRVNRDMDGGYAWAETFDGYIKRSILEGNDENVIDYQRAGSSASHAFHLMDHYAPLLYALGAKDESDPITVFNDACVLGSLSMTGYLFG